MHLDYYGCAGGHRVCLCLRTGHYWWRGLREPSLGAYSTRRWPWPRTQTRYDTRRPAVRLMAIQRKGPPPPPWPGRVAWPVQEPVVEMGAEPIWRTSPGDTLGLQRLASSRGGRRESLRLRQNLLYEKWKMMRRRPLGVAVVVGEWLWAIPAAQSEGVGVAAVPGRGGSGWNCRRHAAQGLGQLGRRQVGRRCREASG